MTLHSEQHEINALLPRIKVQLDRLGWTVATAESLTAGMLCSTLATLPGSSSYLIGGSVCYTLAEKVRLGVNEEHARSVDCVSERVAREMATGIMFNTAAHVGMACTGLAEASGDKPAQACVAIFMPGELWTESFVIIGHNRTEARRKVVLVLLERLHAMLLKVY